MGGKKRKKVQTGNRNRHNWFEKKKQRKIDNQEKWQSSSTQEELSKNCPNFEKHYKGLNIVPESEWESFIETLAAPLPTTFRISGINGFDENLMSEMKARLSASEGKEMKTIDGDIVTPPVTLPWYPNNMGWILGATKRQLKRSTDLASFREFLMQETARGNITRQEAVSMIPPLLLDVQPGHYVLDMCAAPGSKTAQLLEGLYSTTYKGPEGMVVANDVDPKRAYLLTHQVKRMDTADFLVTTHEGQFFPNMLVAKKLSELKEAESTMEVDEPVEDIVDAMDEKKDEEKVDENTVEHYPDGEVKKPSLKDTHNLVNFDRILCDVPCSGDGTLRKNPNLWREWSSHMGQGLHPLQIMIAQRAAKLLKIGGYMVYSTCSFNPIENEAVVAELIRTSMGSLEIVDVSDRLPGLHRAPGLLEWKVLDKNEVWYETMDDCPANRWRRVKPSMFPQFSPEEHKKMGLQHCLRLLPHKQNTGGFFVALIRKTGRMPQPRDVPPTWEAPPKTEEMKEREAAKSAEIEIRTKAKAEARAKADAENKEAAAKRREEKAKRLAAEGKEMKIKKKKKKKPEYAYFPISDEAWNTLQSFYGLRDTLDRNLLFGRSETFKKIYYVSPPIAAILRVQRNARLKVVHTGVRIFEMRNERSAARQLKCMYRVCQEGSDLIEKHVTYQKLYLMEADFTQLLQHTSLRLNIFSEPLRSSILNGHNGCMMFVLPGPNRASNRAVSVAVWKTPYSVNLMMAKAEQVSLLNKFGLQKIDVKSESSSSSSNTTMEEEKKAE